VLYGKEDIRYLEIEKPKIKENEVLVKVAISGICGSDKSRVFGDTAKYYPIVLGHEFSGKIVEIGEKVTNIKIGDKVAGVPLIPCHNCDNCKNGDHALCKKYSFVGLRQQGSFAEYVALPCKNIIKLGEGVSYEQGALFEPSTVALHGLRRPGYKGGKNVAVIGAGNIGIFVIQWAKIFGAKKVVVFDINEDRLKLAKKFGADETINISKEGSIQILKELKEGKGFDYVYEATGKNETVGLSFDLAGSRAKICSIGTFTEKLEFSPEQFEQMSRKEFTLTGSWMSYSSPFPGDEWELTAHFFSTGQLKSSKEMILDKFPLSKAKEAFDLFKDPKMAHRKILLVNENFE